MKVLIIDDDVITRHVLSKFLGERSFVPQTAEHGLAALHILRQDRDIVKLLLDISMPEMDAYDMMSTIQGDPHLCSMPYEIHIISNTDKESILSEMAARSIDIRNVRNILKKPVDLEMMAFALSV